MNTPPPPKPSKGQKKKEEIIQGALECFAEYGLGGTTLGQIGRHLNLSPSLLLYHFKDLDQIFQLVVQKVVAHGRQLAEEAMAEAKNAEGLLRIYIEALFDWMSFHPKYRIIYMQFYHQTLFKPEIRYLQNQILEGGYQNILGILQWGIKEKKFPPTQMEIKVKMAQDLITGALIRMTTSLEQSNITLHKIQTYQTILALFSLKELEL